MEHPSYVNLPIELLATIAKSLMPNFADFRSFVLLTNRLLRMKITHSTLFRRWDFWKDHTKDSDNPAEDWTSIVKFFPRLEHFSANYFTRHVDGLTYSSNIFELPRSHLQTLHLTFGKALQSCFVRVPQNGPPRLVPLNLGALFPCLVDLVVMEWRKEPGISDLAVLVDFLRLLPRKLTSLGLGTLNMNSIAFGELPPLLRSFYWRGAAVDGATFNDAPESLRNSLNSFRFSPCFAPSSLVAHAAQIYADGRVLSQAESARMIDLLISIPPECKTVSFVDVPWTDEFSSVLPRHVEHLKFENDPIPTHAPKPPLENRFTHHSFELLPQHLKSLHINASLAHYQYDYSPVFYTELTRRLTALESFTWDFPSLTRVRRPPATPLTLPMSLTYLDLNKRSYEDKLWTLRQWPRNLTVAKLDRVIFDSQSTQAFQQTPLKDLHTLHIRAFDFIRASYLRLPRTLTELKLEQAAFTNQNVPDLPPTLTCLIVNSKSGGYTSPPGPDASRQNFSDECLHLLPRSLTKFQISGPFVITGLPVARRLAALSRSDANPNSTSDSSSSSSTQIASANSSARDAIYETFRHWDKATVLANCRLDLPLACHVDFNLAWEQKHMSYITVDLCKVPRNLVRSISLPTSSLTAHIWRFCYYSVRDIATEYDSYELDKLEAIFTGIPARAGEKRSSAPNLTSLTIQSVHNVDPSFIKKVPKTVTKLSFLKTSCTPYWYGTYWCEIAGPPIPLHVRHLTITTFNQLWGKKSLFVAKYLVVLEITHFDTMLKTDMQYLPKTLKKLIASTAQDERPGSHTLALADLFNMDSWISLLPSNIKELKLSKTMCLSDRALAKIQKNAFTHIEVGVIVIRGLPEAYTNVKRALSKPSPSPASPKTPTPSTKKTGLSAKLTSATGKIPVSAPQSPAKMPVSPAGGAKKASSPVGAKASGKTTGAKSAASTTPIWPVAPSATSPSRISGATPPSTPSRLASKATGKAAGAVKVTSPIQAQSGPTKATSSVTATAPTCKAAASSLSAAISPSSVSTTEESPASPPAQDPVSPNDVASSSQPSSLLATTSTAPKRTASASPLRTPQRAPSRASGDHQWLDKIMESPYNMATRIIVPFDVIEAYKSTPLGNLALKAHRFVVEWTAVTHIVLPSSLTDLRFVNSSTECTEAVSDNTIQGLPRSLLHLHIPNQSLITSRCIPDLPNQLLTLKIDGRNVSDSALRHLPATLTELTILDGTHGSNASELKFPPNLKLLHLLVDRSSGVENWFSDEHVQALPRSLEDLRVDHSTKLTANAFAQIPRSVTKLHLNCPHIYDFDPADLPPGLTSFSATPNCALDGALKQRRV